MSAACQLCHEENMELIRRAQRGDAGALEAAAEGNLALVRSVVRRYLNRGVEYEDLMQLGSMGLVKAIRRFDTALGLRFSTYAVPMIAGEIKRFLRDDGMVKVSRTVKELAIRAASAAEALSDSLGRSPGVREIADALGEDPADVAVALDALRPTVSLNESFGEEPQGAERIDFLPGRENEEEKVNGLFIRELMVKLEPREQEIIRLRFYGDLTQGEIASRLGISQVQVSRLLGRILLKMRNLAESGEG